MRRRLVQQISTMNDQTLNPSPFMCVCLFVGCFAALLSLPLAAQDQHALPAGMNTGIEAAQNNQISSSASSLVAASSIAAVLSTSVSESESESESMLLPTVSENSAVSVSSASSASLVSSMVSSSSSESTELAVQIKQDLTPLEKDNQPLAEPVMGAEAELEPPTEPISLSKFILGQEVKPNSSVRLTWSSDTAVGGFSEETPILVVNGAKPGKTLCLTAAVHGDELNGIEMIRRVVYGIEPANLTGTIIGVPVANIMGFRRNSRYLPDRRDWNRYFPGNTHGSSASRLAHSFFSNVIMHCDALVDIHTGSFHRTNLAQLRADLSDENVAKLAQSFGAIAVLNSRGNPNSLRAAAVRAGIPAVTLEAGEPMAIQSSVVDEGVAAVNTLLAKMGMYGKQKRWTRIAPVYYRSAWVRANQSGILFSKATLGQRVREDDVLGTVTDPITNARTTIKSPYTGRIIGMALDQVVLPGFAAYHIGIQTPEAILIEESQMSDGVVEEDEEDGDDAGLDPIDEKDEPETGMSKAQDRMADE